MLLYQIRENKAKRNRTRRNNIHSHVFRCRGKRLVYRAWALCRWYLWPFLGFFCAYRSIPPACKKSAPREERTEKMLPPQLLSHKLLTNNGMRKERKHFLPKKIFSRYWLNICNLCDGYILSHVLRFVNITKGFGENMASRTKRAWKCFAYVSRFTLASFTKSAAVKKRRGME